MSIATKQHPTPELASLDRVRRRCTITGLVQGVGFRPFVYATATELHLTGSVVNTSSGVLVEVEGDVHRVEQFLSRLTGNPPPLAIVQSIEVETRPVRGGTGFHIGDTAAGSSGRTLASPDVATCADCLADMTDPGNRRYRHPFVSCTNCGPRFTIITSLPYDRVTTTMAGFDMCPACRVEYSDPADRRFHAQPIACRDCGPRLELRTPDGSTVRGDDAAMAAARGLLGAGSILAVKGIGGYHLVCDAGNETSVAELRRRKRRGDKPFAVMAADIDTANRLVDIDTAEAALLTDPARPIVLLGRRRTGSEDAVGALETAAAPVVAPSVAPGNPDLGVMLPYTPLHSLLFGLPGDSGSPPVLVMTSGNLSGEPIITDDDIALALLAPLVDGWLRHDRPIQVPCDDSVSRVVDGEPLPIRRSRGYAPLPLALPESVTPTLAVGADLKNACCLADGRYAWMSQHIGDMDDLRSLQTLTDTAAHMAMLTGIQPQEVISDRHPGYRTTDWARGSHRHVAQVQHHHAHICSVMAEHGLDGRRPVIGIAFDGTGFGSDGAVWGGELLICRYQDFQRLGHLAYVPLPGGDAAVERPYRMALSHLRASGVPWDENLACVACCPPDELAVLDRQLASGFGCVPTSSMGRLFDAVSAIAGVRQVADYEAQAAIELEGAARAIGAAEHPPEGGDDGYRFSLADLRGELLVDSSPVIRAVAADAVSGAGSGDISGDISRRFHRAVVDLIVDLAVHAQRATGLSTVALSGGVFQNSIVLRGACRALRRTEFTVLRHRRVPPNDGGLALGQVMAATKRMDERSSTCV